MKCPICVQEVLDHQERWGPEFAHSRCIIAFNAGSAVQDAKLQAYIKRLEEAGDRMYWTLEAEETGSVGKAMWNKAMEAKP